VAQFVVVSHFERHRKESFKRNGPDYVVEYDSQKPSRAGKDSKWMVRVASGTNDNAARNCMENLQYFSLETDLLQLNDNFI